MSFIGEDPDNPDVFRDTDATIAPIRDSINDAIQEIHLVHGGHTEKFNIPLVADKRFYRVAFQGGFLGWINDAWLVNQKRRLHHTGIRDNDHNDPRWLLYNGTPEDYFIVGLDVIGFRPIPSSSSDIVEVTCSVIPAHYKTDRDRVKLRDSFKWAVVNYAVSEYWASRGDAREASKHMQVYLDNLGIQDRFSLTQDRINELNTNKLSNESVTRAIQ